MMLRKLLSLSILVLLASCGTVKKTTSYSTTRTVTIAASKSDKTKFSIPKKETIKEERLPKANAIINSALGYSGVRYKYGGTTKKGIDCSGLLYVSFLENDIPLPRVSYHMAEKGKRIKISKISKGDLLFFKTRKAAKRINHVGMVVAVEGKDIKFIHASSSRGVIVSSLREGYWNKAFVKATRVL